MSSEQVHIRLLPPELCNQIAAGEVVERPASVVKELVENSLDALATCVDVTVENGGQGLIRVQDDGIGMLHEELELAVTRHATSKISGVEDLENINSYGFRGEALPSVASVARCSVASMGAGQEEAWALDIAFGKIEGERPDALHKGTIVEIRDLFANVPARLKFLRGMSTEVKHCQEWLSRLALARPDVAFSLVSDGRELLRFLPGQTVMERLEIIWPKLITEALLPFDSTRHGIRVHGYTARPDVCQPRGTRQLLFVNGRSVSDKKLLGAIREAYKGRLTSREHPQVVLFVEMDPQEVDVNVHPAKSEVRFRDERAVFSAVLLALRSALETLVQETIPEDVPGMSPEAGFGAAPEGAAGTAAAQADLAAQPGKPVPAGTPNDAPNDAPDDARNDAAAAPKSEWGYWGRLDKPLNPAMTFNQDKFGPKNGSKGGYMDGSADGSVEWLVQGQDERPESPAQGAGEETARAAAFLERSLPGMPFSEKRQESVAEAGEQPVLAERGFSQGQERGQGSTEPGPGAAGISIGGLTYLGQIARTYLVFRDSRDALVLLDQHAAHERVLYAKITAHGYQGQGQILALPVELGLHASEAQRWMEVQGMLCALGFSAELRAGTLVVRAVPALLNRMQAVEFLKETLAGRKDDYNAKFASMACKAAIKAGQVLTVDEVGSLMRQWLMTPNKENCPHGRPTFLRWDTQQLEKLFKRRLS